MLVANSENKKMMNIFLRLLSILSITYSLQVKFDERNNHHQLRTHHQYHHLNCGTEEISMKRKEEIENVVQIWRARAEEEIYFNSNNNLNNVTKEFDVYVHVIHDGQQGYLSDDSIISLINNLNNAFSGQQISSCFDRGDDYDTDTQGCEKDFDFLHTYFQKKGNQNPKNNQHLLRKLDEIIYGSVEPGNGVNTGIFFTLKDVTRSDNAVWFHDMENQEEVYKSDLRKGDCSSLNIYTGESIYLGWSTYPDACSVRMTYDGVVMNYQTLPGGTNPFDNEGDVLVHDVGHWLGLYHTFEGGCEEWNGDQIIDTAAQEKATEGCPIKRDSCVGQGNDPIHNFMVSEHILLLVHTHLIHNMLFSFILPLL